MDTERIAHTPAPYTALAGFTLRRVNQDGTEQRVSEHPDFGEGWAEGQRMTHAEPEAAFSLYDRRRQVARFGHHRLAPRLRPLDLNSLPLA